jgi:hypothetical protein
VDFAIRLIVAVNVDASDSDATLDRVFPNRGGDLRATSLHRPRTAHVNGDDGALASTANVVGHRHRAIIAPHELVNPRSATPVPKVTDEHHLLSDCT